MQIPIFVIIIESDYLEVALMPVFSFFNSTSLFVKPDLYAITVMAVSIHWGNSAVFFCNLELSSRPFSLQFRLHHLTTHGTETKIVRGNVLAG